MLKIIILLMIVCYSCSTEIVKNQQVNEEIDVKCAEHMGYFLNGVTNRDTWALQMLDASSKLPAGIMKGNLGDMGYFEECLEVEYKISQDDVIIGKHCMSQMQLKLNDSNQQVFQNNKYKISLSTSNNFLVHLSFCIPNSCSLPQYMARANVSVPLRINGPNEKALFVIDNCQSKDDLPDFTVGDGFASAFFAVIGVTLLLSTTYDLFLHSRSLEPVHLSFVTFSLYSNGKNLFSVAKGTNQLLCINGIRVLSMCWIIFGHRYFVTSARPILNTSDYIKFTETWYSQYATNSQIAVDTFFLVSGLLLSYLFMANVERGIKFNIIKFYVHRYIRLTPVLAVVILINATVLKHFGSGPFWPLVYNLQGNICKNNWWLTLLYVQNYVKSNEMCVFQAWYLAVDMQLYILSPIILIPLSKWPTKSLIAVGILIVASLASTFVIAWIYEIPALDFYDANFNEKYYYVTHTRAATWLLGIIVGFFIHKIKSTKIQLSTAFKVCGWILSLTTIAAIIFGSHNFKHHEYNRVETTIFLTFQRISWALAVAWIIFACLRGFGGPVNSFLSLPIFQITSRLTYTLYITHLGLQFIMLGNIRTTQYFSELESIYEFGGDLLYNITLAAILSLSIELPVQAIEKVILKK